MAGTSDSRLPAQVQATTEEAARTRLPSPRRGGAGGEVAPTRLPLSREIRALGRTLGPRMPSPRSGTVTNDIGRVIRDIKSASRVEYRVEKAGIIHTPIGKRSFTPEQLAANALALIEAIVRAKPAAAKGTYLRTLTVSSTMSPGVPMRRGGQPEEVAAAIVWLLSDAASFVTGAFIDVSGGR